MYDIDWSKLRIKISKELRKNNNIQIADAIEYSDFMYDEIEENYTTSEEVIKLIKKKLKEL